MVHVTDIPTAHNVIDANKMATGKRSTKKTFLGCYDSISLVCW
ncbi:hypothetical protein RE6C_04273 [Rhodopirellula europaea 6C]|uniref:Uncharacterized protein n=1 Tax=Rhodopirellula europaea 6C TaxID=1263867 RepID=M2A4X5_9BACT|nr:hypothetical protein RE6C_04273 [Rhodopirellula europaea 6C]